MIRLACMAFISLGWCISVFAQAPFENSTFPHEASYQQRIAGLLPLIAAKGFGIRGKARSTCPDTGLPVFTYALEGETIVSPYTGVTYLQGPTGYFGPKARDAQGRITAFGGDPLKYELPAATAALLLDPEDAAAKAFLHIPGNLNQQYHFAAKNWARAYPLLAELLGPQWQADFQAAVANYSESRRPSDGDREHNFLSKPHNLVGEEGELLAGNVQDGGTENHKVMWRTTALLYSQWFPEGSKISGFSLPDAQRITFKALQGFGQKMLQLGNGEYDSQIYYPHSMYGFYNLHDLSPDPKTKHLGKFFLDYYLLTYSLKAVDGAFAGAQKRGFLTGKDAAEMRSHLWAYFGASAGQYAGSKPISSLHQVTSSYRPNRVIANIFHKNIPLPFSAQMTRPDYHMRQANVFQESFYCSHSFALGNVAMTRVDNPGQQVVWSLVLRTPKGPLSVGGGQPRYLKPEGHSPYTQTFQHRNVLVVLSSDTEQPSQAAAPTLSQQERQRAAADPLNLLKLPKTADKASLTAFLAQAKQSASSWCFLPTELGEPKKVNNSWVFETDSTFLVIHPLTAEVEWLAWIEGSRFLPEEDLSLLKRYNLLMVHGKPSGYVLEAIEKRDFTDWEALKVALTAQPKINLKEVSTRQLVNYVSLGGDRIEVKYKADDLRCEASVNNQAIAYEQWANGGVYDSPYLKVKEGKMWVSDGKESYQVDFTGELPVYRID